MISFLLDTLLATGALIVLVMLVRKPVARAFGPQMAYALWLLPLLRFVMPPIVLPAGFAPHAELAPATPVASSDAPPEAVVAMVSPVATPEFTSPVEPTTAAILPWGELLLVLWLGGALAFLAWRFVSYRRMREDLLAEARPVGEVGKIRLVETPAVSGPVAFGLLDKVVALPMHFMALEDRAARDLAIAHELAHHKGRDLAANILAQPLLALHWFNPLAWLAWRAMRRDQEAACDARVLAVRDRTERARYAEVIASFAAGPRLALAAPMACPMVGEKSIIHRLRSLGMQDVSRGRRMLGRSLLVAGGLALPLTATITYAANELPEVPEAPDAPLPPEAPLALDAPDVRQVRSMVVIDVEGGADPNDPALHTRTVTRDGQTIVLKTVRPVSADEAQVRIERAMRSMPEVNVVVAPNAPTPPAPPAPAMPARGEWTEAQEAEFEKQWEKWGEDMERWGEEFGKQHAAQAQAHAAQAEAWAQAARQNTPEVIHSCGGDPKVVARQERTADGRPRIVICQKVATRQALHGLRSARNTIARDRNIDPEVRDEVLSDLDGEISRIESES